MKAVARSYGVLWVLLLLGALAVAAVWARPLVALSAVAVTLPPTFGEFLTFVGTTAAVGAAISFLAQYWPAFNQLDPLNKRLFMFAVAAVMGLLSYAAVKYLPVGVVQGIEPFYQIILFALSILGGNQLYYSFVVKPAERAKAAQKWIDSHADAWGWPGRDAGFRWRRPAAYGVGIDGLLALLDPDTAQTHRLKFLRDLGVAVQVKEAEPSKPPTRPGEHGSFPTRADNPIAGPGDVLGSPRLT